MMDLPRYEQLKFELADVIRSAQLTAPDQERNSDRWRDLLTRLAEDRFTVVVAGRFSRGKSTLMNAVLGLDRLPTGIVPLTSVITSVRYGTSERVVLEYLGTRLCGEARLDEFAELVTARGNPENVKRLRSVEIQLPAEILRRGFFFVDTPGLGSAILENTKTAERFIPEIDMLILVTGFESPLSEDELRFLQRTAGAVRAIFIVINKHDTVPLLARREVVEFVDARVRTALPGQTFRLFSVSAKDGLTAKLANDPDALRESGIQDLETELVRLLAREKAHLFLSSMCDRVHVSLELLPDRSGNDLRARLRGIAERLTPQQCGDRRRASHPSEGQTPSADGLAALSLGTCEVCTAVADDQFGFLARYQFELSSRASAREEHAARGGFCPLHTWRYEQISSPRAVCTAYPPLLARTAARLRSWAAGPGPKASPDPPALEPRCPVCELRRATEDRVIASMLGQATGSLGALEPFPRMALCLPHLRLLVGRSNNTALRRHLLSLQAVWLERIAEDMQRYAVKHDGLRRSLASDEERDASYSALQVLAGRRNVNGLAATSEGP